MSLDEMNMISSKNRNSLIELYRVIFALTVVSHHAQYLDARWTDGTAHFVPLLGGNTAVEFFFILSGFFISKAAYQEKDNMDMKKLCTAAWKQDLKKLTAVYPLFFLSYIVAFCTRQLVYRENLFTVIHNFLGSISELALVRWLGFAFLPYEYIGPMWYFSVLLVVVLTLYPIMARLREVFTIWIAPLLILVIYGHSFITTGMVDATYALEAYLRGVAGVSLGNIVYLLAGRYRLRLTERGKYVTAAAEVGVLFCILGLENIYSYDYRDFIEIALYCVLIYLAFASVTPLNHLFDPIAAMFGPFSAALYVSHIAIVLVPWGKLCLPWRYVWMAWMVYTFALAVSILYIRKGFMRLLAKWSIRLRKAILADE